MNRFLLALLALSFFSCGDGATTGPGVHRDVKDITDVGSVLFLGNSLTSRNSLAAMVDSLGARSGITIKSRAIAPGGYGLIDHFNDLDTRRVVAEGHFDVVILQQGPSSLPESRVLLREWSQLWKPVIRDSGARAAFYAVWPDKSRFFAFPDVSESYRLAAEDLDALFFPVGDTWLEIWKLNPEAPLYVSDDFHPSVAGTYAAAVVIVSVLAKRSPSSLSADYSVDGAVDSTLAATIRRAAETVLERQRPRQRADGP